MIYDNDNSLFPDQVQLYFFTYPTFCHKAYFWYEYPTGRDKSWSREDLPYCTESRVPHASYQHSYDICDIYISGSKRENVRPPFTRILINNTFWAFLIWVLCFPHQAGFRTSILSSSNRLNDYKIFYMGHAPKVDKIICPASDANVEMTLSFRCCVRIFS